MILGWLWEWLVLFSIEGCDNVSWHPFPFDFLPDLLNRITFFLSVVPSGPLPDLLAPMIPCRPSGPSDSLSDLLVLLTLFLKYSGPSDYLPDLLALPAFWLFGLSS